VPSPVHVSVVCPTYNRSRAILRTLASVSSQSCREWEMLVVSDGSTDDTDDVVRAAAVADPRIRLIRSRAFGDPSEPRNIALAVASGDIVSYIDHDDRWREDHLRRVLDVMDGGAELVAMGNIYRDEHGRALHRSSPYEMCWHPEIQLLSAVFETSRVSHRRPLLDEAGGWHEVPGFEDWDLWHRMTDLGHRFTTLNEQTVRMLGRTGTRRHKIRPRYRLPIAVYDDARTASAALDELRDVRHRGLLRSESIADMRGWLGRIMETSEFVRPEGWAGDPRTYHAQRITRSSTPATGLVIVPRPDGFAIAQPLYCANAEHADRIEAAALRSQQRLYLAVHEITARFRPHAIASISLPAGAPAPLVVPARASAPGDPTPRHDELLKV